MMVPVIHSNGDTKETLLAELRQAITKLQDAKYALQEMTIHGRNYYPISTEAFMIARLEQNERLKKIQQVIEDVYALAIHIQDGRFGEQEGVQ